MKQLACPLALMFLAGLAFAQDPAKQKALDEVELVFRPAVFAGEQLPRVQVQSPGLVRAALGEVTLRTTYYDAAFNEVTSATKPGRYGAVTEIAAPGGLKSMRFTTLFRRPGAGQQQVRWDRMRIDGVTLPAELGIDPAIAREQAEAINRTATMAFGEAMSRSGTAAVLLAGLYETKAGEGPLPRRSMPAAKDWAWWYQMKKKLGMDVGYKYWTVLPAGYDKAETKAWPLLLFLHGAGERGNNLDMLRVHGPHKHYPGGKDQPFIMIYPQCPAGQWWSPEMLSDLLDSVMKQHRIDPDRVYLTGLSMGGYGSWDLAANQPERFAAVVPICGGGVPDDAERLRKLPIWTFHGAKDPVVPVERTLEMVEALKKLGAPVQCTIYPEAQHDSWTETYNNPELYRWLLRQKRNR